MNDAASTKATLILGRDGMGPHATDWHFHTWAIYVCEHIDEACGFEVEVMMRGYHDVQDDEISGDDEARTIVQEAKARLWDDWCAEGASGSEGG
jgi:hypothetical protein